MEEEVLLEKIMFALRRTNLIVILLLLSIGGIKAQSLVWQGTQDTDFFNEANWIIDGTAESPAPGTLESGVAISENLVINGYQLSLNVTEQLSFSSSVFGLTLTDASINLGSIASGTITLNGKSTLILQADLPFNSTLVKLESARSWIKLINVDPVEAGQTYLNNITSQGLALVIGENVSIDQYYFKGSLIRLKDAAYHPLTLFDDFGQSGSTFTVPVKTIIKRTELGDFDNAASSFSLERGFMAVMNVYQNGTGKSEVYIASEEDLQMDLPAALNNTVSFVRVMPWNWVTKKGASGFEEVGNSWTYNWGNGGESLPNMEYAPMSWGSGGATLASVANYVAMDEITHVMGFNESDNCFGQSGQWGGLCQIEVAVPLFENLMRTGLRLVSPSPRENGPFGWSKDFRDLAVATDVRYDVLGVHWYDWGGNPKNTPFEDPQVVFNHFKNYLDRVYAEHQMPIWITEFNANANRDISVHRGFLELALPYLESLDFVERYDYFVPNPDVADNRTDITYPTFFDEQGIITPFGEFYRDFESTPAIPEPVIMGSGFLSGMDEKITITMVASKTALMEGESLTLSFATSRPLGAIENFTVTITGIDEAQYSLAANLIEIPEGGSTAEVLLTAVDDDLIEEIMTGSISLTGLSSGIEWSGTAIDFTIESEDEEIPLSVINADVIDISVYPNPTERFVRIEANSKIEEIGIISLPSGKEVQRELRNGNEIDFLALSPGVYIVRVYLANGATVNKLVYKE